METTLEHGERSSGRPAHLTQARQATHTVTGMHHQANTPALTPALSEHCAAACPATPTLPPRAASCQRYIFIKLTYHDHTPDPYEPPYFHGVAEEGIGHFHRRPFSM